MLEEKDLQAIAQLMDSKLEQQRKDIIHGVKILMENEVKPKFDLLAEGQQIIRDKLEHLDDLEVMDTRISALEAMVKKLNRDIQKMKKAQ